MASCIRDVVVQPLAQVLSAGVAQAGDKLVKNCLSASRSIALKSTPDAESRIGGETEFFPTGKHLNKQEMKIKL